MTDVAPRPSPNCVNVDTTSTGTPALGSNPLGIVGGADTLQYKFPGSIQGTVGLCDGSIFDNEWVLALLAIAMIPTLKAWQFTTTLSKHK